jgi:Protein of unknown function (DUF1189)
VKLCERGKSPRVKIYTMQSDKTPGFLQTFIGSFVSFKSYPNFIKRSGLSFFGHYLLLVVLCCSLYAFATTSWLNTNLSPHLAEFAQSVPTISVTDGQASVEIEQPHFFEIEKEVIAVIDTTQDPDVYLDEYKQIVVISKDRISSKDTNGKVQSFKFSEIESNFTVDAALVQDWVNVLESWFLPGLFIVCFLWQVCWKAVQVLITATIVTLIQKSRPEFAVHLKLATMALCPAMIFGVVVYSIGLFAYAIPSAGFVFWAILGGLTYYGSDLLKKTPDYS